MAKSFTVKIDDRALAPASEKTAQRILRAKDRA